MRRGWSLVLLLSFTPGVSVAAVPSFHAKTNRTINVTAQPGESKKISFFYVNDGRSTWMKGAQKTSLYIYGNTSALQHGSWMTSDQVALLDQAQVKAGQKASVTFWVQAPKAPGVYREKFLLSYGPNQWLQGSRVDLTLRVNGGSSATSVSERAASVDVVVPTVLPPSPPVAQTIPIVSSGARAELVEKGGLEWQLTAGNSVRITVGFKNVGNSAWSNTGASAMALTTGGKKSLFQDASWVSEAVVTKLTEKSIRPGEVGHFTFTVQAPQRASFFREAFSLSVGSTSVPGGEIVLPLRVVFPDGYIPANVMNGVDPSMIDQVAQTVQGTLLLRSATELTLLGNGRQAINFGFKNTGTSGWGNLLIRFMGVTPKLTPSKLSNVRDDSWLSSSDVAQAMKSTPPGEIGFIAMTVKAPPKKGSYTARFQLFADNRPVDGAVIEIPISVTTDGYIAPDPVPSSIASAYNGTASTPASTPARPAIVAQPLSGDVSTLPDEPIIRVGIFKTTDNQTMLRGVGAGFEIRNGGSVVCRLNAGEVATMQYDRASAMYRATGPNCAVTSPTPLVAQQADGISPLEMTDFSRPVGWLPGANDNTFRAKIELRYAPITDSVWVINELPIEYYLKGMAETSDVSPMEYQRALLTAARTYAMYHYQRGTKHAAEFYTVDATYDQVYRGYGAEKRSPNICSAVDSTRGQIVMFNGKLAITPYYSRSDGRTRDWTEVWGGGPYPWLKSVTVPWDQGKTLWGHGVGLSASGALGMARDNRGYDEILKYFYTGIELRRAYK